MIVGMVAGLMVSPFGDARAASQALALLEIDEATPLICTDGVCRAEFTTYCLQKDRALPQTGTPYEVAEGDGPLLVLTDAKGNVRRVPAAPHIRIEAARANHTAVTISVPRHIVDGFEARQVALEVGERMTLMPVAVAGDDNPLSEQERRDAAGRLRATGAELVDRVGGTVETVRVLNSLINAMPDSIEIDSEARGRLWQRALDAEFATAMPMRVDDAAREYAACWQDRVVQLGGYSVRECLRRRHDDLMWNHTKRYWDAVGPAS
jgi:hypothetical protein